jgi:penicillin-binding protein 2
MILLNQKHYFLKYQRLIIVILACFLAILGRLCYLQLYQAKHLYRLSQNNFTRIQKLQPPRGNICDVHGNLLATNRPVKNIVWVGSGERKLTPQQIEILTQILHINGFEVTDELLKKVQMIERGRHEFILFEDIPFNILSKIEEQFSGHPNIAIQNSFKRFYPYQKQACHLIGYLGTLDLGKTGKMGLEKILEDELKGKSGANQTTINSVGRKIDATEIEQAVMSRDITTTIDMRLQTICEEKFDEENLGLRGSIIIMDPETGAIQTLLSRPDFNPTTFLEPLTDQDWADLQTMKPFVNRALSACYPPASLFKLITVATGLELGLVTPDSTINCQGHITFVDRKYHCNNRDGHGPLNIRHAIAKSCNILFYRLGQAVSIDVLAEYARKFGLGSKTGIVFQEASGLIPDSAWKIKTKGERWWMGETLSASIGQSYLLVTPIQVARYISSIFTGYLVQPRVLADEPVIKTKLQIRPETLEFLQDSMRKVITSGTGVRINTINDLIVYAKSGTAQACALHADPDHHSSAVLEHAWFASHFSYKNQKPLTMIIMVENVGSARVAINIARKILNQYRLLMAKQLETN